MDLEYKQITNSGTTVTIVGRDINRLVDNVLLYRRKNKIGETEYNKVYNEVKGRIAIGQKVSPKITAESVIEAESKKSNKKRKISFHDAMRAAAAIADISKGNIVDQTEIERRASICAGCPLISDVSDCIGCGAGARITKAVLGLQKESGAAFNVPMIQRNGKSGAESLSKMFCHHCGCSCLTLCVCKMEHIRTEGEEKNQSRPDHCWMKRGGVNYID